MKKGETMPTATRLKLIKSWEDDPARKQKYFERLRKRGMLRNKMGPTPISTQLVDPDFDEFGT